MLNKPCYNINNKNTKKSLNILENTPFIDAITYVTYMGIIGKDAFDRSNKKDENSEK